MADATSGILNYYINNYLDRDYSTGRTASIPGGSSVSSTETVSGTDDGSFASILAKSLDEASRAGMNSTILAELAGGTNSSSMLSALSSLGNDNSSVLSELLGSGQTSSLISGSGSSALSSLLSGNSMDQTSLLSAVSGSSKSSSSGTTNSSLESIFEAASRKYDVPLNLLKAVAKAESGFRADAVSSAGAQGIMQLMPATARSLGVTDSFDPEQNIMGGAKYLAQMLDRYNGNIDLTLAAYNAGSGAVAKYGGVPPYAETRNYIARVKNYMGEGVSVPNVSVSGSKTGVSESGLEDLDAATMKKLSEALTLELQMNIMKMEMNLLDFDDDDDSNSSFSYLSSII